MSKEDYKRITFNIYGGLDNVGFTDKVDCGNITFSLAWAKASSSSFSFDSCSRRSPDKSTKEKMSKFKNFKVKDLILHQVEMFKML